jgi:hypothetical protein
MDLNDWLKLNNDVIVDLARKYVPTEIIKEPTFEALTTLLMGKFVHRHGSEEEIGKRSQAHNVLAMTMILTVLTSTVQEAQANPCAVENEGNIAGVDTDCVFGALSGFVEIEQDDE